MKVESVLLVANFAQNVMSHKSRIEEFEINIKTSEMDI